MDEMLKQLKDLIILGIITLIVFIIADPFNWRKKFRRRKTQNKEGE